MHYARLDTTEVIPSHGMVRELLAGLPPEDVAAVVRWEHLR